jgi:spore coat protein A, manganese oxidase
MFSRRAFLETGVLAGAGLFLPGKLGARPARIPINGAALRRFIDPLPKPRVIAPIGYAGAAPVYGIAVTEFEQQLHSDLAPTTVWGYDGSFPGPTIEARRGEPLHVIWSNELGSGSHLLPVDRTLHGTHMGEPDRRIVTHLHGGIVPPAADGFPEAWFTDGYTAEYIYPNSQRAATLWYHDHSLGITRLNVQAGMAAFYLLRDEEEDDLIEQGLPSGDYEIPIAIQDRSFNADGSLFYPAVGMTTEHPVWSPEFFGDVAVVNGVAYPVLQVQPRRYRLRLLNGCNARFLNLQLFRYNRGTYRGNGPAFVVIGTDGGLLPAPVPIARGSVPRRMLMAPAERADVIVDFSAFAGQELVLHNNAPTPFSGFVQGNARPPVQRPGHPIGAGLPEIMLFRVSDGAVSDPGVIPAVLSPGFERLDPAAAVITRQITLEEVLDPAGMPLEALIRGQHWTDAITENRAFGTTEIWHLINRTADSHPIHLHLDHFQVLWRRAFDPARFVLGTTPRWKGPPEPPAPEESGWKDTVVAHPGEVTAIVVRSDSYTGIYLYHCHILEHEDNEMMLRFSVG